MIPTITIKRSLLDRGSVGNSYFYKLEKCNLNGDSFPRFKYYNEYYVFSIYRINLHVTRILCIFQRSFFLLSLRLAVAIFKLSTLLREVRSN